MKNEGAFIRYQRSGAGWLGWLPDGTRLEFGLTPQGRIEQKVSSAGFRTFRWLLEKETDTNDNVILYSYVSFEGKPGADEQNLYQKYLQRIAYGPGPPQVTNPTRPPWTNYHLVQFAYEDRPDWFEDCRPAFCIATGKRLKQVTIGTSDPSSVATSSWTSMATAASTRSTESTSSPTKGTPTGRFSRR